MGACQRQAFNCFLGECLPFFRATGFFKALLQGVEKVKSLFPHTTEPGHGEYAKRQSGSFANCVKLGVFALLGFGQDGGGRVRVKVCKRMASCDVNDPVSEDFEPAQEQVRRPQLTFNSFC